MEKAIFIKNNKDLSSENEENLFLLNENNSEKEEDLPSTSSYKTSSDDYKTDCVEKIAKNLANSKNCKYIIC